jgi:hypothetical protein
MTATQHDTYGWQFTYIGANQDAFAEAGGMGIARAATMDYVASSAGTAAAYAGTSAAVSRFVTGQSMDTSYTDAERSAAADGQETSNG